MKKNLTISKRLEVIKQKTNSNFDVAIMTDAIETICSKEIKDGASFLDFALHCEDENQYQSGKQNFIVRKKREISEEQRQASFNKQYAKLCQKYGFMEKFNVVEE